jgi:hypothetical protein
MDQPKIYNTLCTPSTEFEKLGFKTVIKHENRGNRFFNNPKYPLKKIENVHI